RRRRLELDRSADPRLRHRLPERRRGTGADRHLQYRRRGDHGRRRPHAARGDPVCPENAVTTRVRPVAREDTAAWLRMRQALCPEYENGWHAKEIDAFLAGRLN